MTPLRATPAFVLLLSLTALLRPLSAHNGAVAIAVPGIILDPDSDDRPERLRQYPIARIE